MKNYYSKIHKDIDPPRDLLTNIFINIAEKKRISKLRAHVFIMTPILLSVLSMSAYVAVLARDSFDASGFAYYASLLFTDTSTIFANIGTYLTLVAETIPVLTTAMLLLGVLGILKTSQYLFKDVDLLLKLETHKHNYAN